MDGWSRQRYAGFMIAQRSPVRLLLSRYILHTAFPLSLVVTHTASSGQWVWGQETDATAEIREPLADADVDSYIKRFERDGREVFDKRHKIVEACLLKEGMAVADIGAGTGFMTRLFSKAVGNTGTVWAVDTSEEFIEHIQESARNEGLSNIRGLVCARDDTRLPPGSIDLTFICDTYHHFESPARTMASLYRALRKGGRLIVIDDDIREGQTDGLPPDSVRADTGTVIREIQRAGFGMVGDANFLDGKYLLRFFKVEPSKK